MRKSIQKALAAALASLVACGGPAPEAVAPEATGKTMQQKKQPWEVYPPDWRAGDTWEIEAEVLRHDYARHVWYPTHNRFEYKVESVPTPDKPHYVVKARALEKTGPQGYRLQFHEGTFDCFLVAGDDQEWIEQRRKYTLMAGVFISGMEAWAPDIWLPTHWPRKPDPDHLWSTQRFPASSASQWDGPVDQTFTYDGQGIKITLEQWTPALNRVKSRTTMQWKMGDPWWSTYEQITDIGLGPVKEVSAKLVRVGPLAPR